MRFLLTVLAAVSYTFIKTTCLNKRDTLLNCALFYSLFAHFRREVFVAAFQEGFQSTCFLRSCHIEYTKGYDVFYRNTIAKAMKLVRLRSKSISFEVLPELYFFSWQCCSKMLKVTWLQSNVDLHTTERVIRAIFHYNSKDNRITIKDLMYNGTRNCWPLGKVWNIFE